VAEGAFWNNWKNTAIPASGGIISNSGAYGGFKGKDGATGNDVAVDPYISDLIGTSPQDRLSISKQLKAAGYKITPSSKYNKRLGDLYIQVNQELAVEKARSGRPELTLREFLVENTQPTSGNAPSLPSRNIYQYTEADKISMLNEVSQTLRGQDITPEDQSAKWYKDLKKSLDNMISTGTLSTSKKVYNPKTKKTEIQTVQTPGFSKEQIAATAEKAIRKATPEEVARKERVDFTGWLFNTLGGK
jgi:hypothetical protein